MHSFMRDYGNRELLREANQRERNARGLERWREQQNERLLVAVLQRYEKAARQVA